MKLITSLNDADIQGLAKDLGIGIENAKIIVLRRIFSSNVDKTLATQDLLGVMKNFETGHDAYILIWDAYEKYLNKPAIKSYVLKVTEYKNIQRQVIEKWIALVKPLFKDLYFANDSIIQIYLELDDDPLQCEFSMLTHEAIKVVMEKIKSTKKLSKKLELLKDLWVVLVPGENYRWVATKSVRGSEPGYGCFGTSMWRNEYEEVDKLWKEISEETFSKLTEDDYFTKDFVLITNHLHHCVNIYGDHKVTKMTERAFAKAFEKVSNPDTPIKEALRIGKMYNSEKIRDAVRERIVSSYIK